MFVVSALGGLLAYSITIPWLGMLGTSTYRELNKDCVSPNEHTEVRVDWIRASRWPLPWLEFQDHWVHQGTGETTIIRRLAFPWFRNRMTFVYPMEGLSRGIYRLELVEVYGGEGLGLAQWSRSFAAEQELTVYPAPFVHRNTAHAGDGQTQAMAAPAYMPQENWTPQLRGYVPGDPMNRIHWKATAKSGELQIREMPQQRSEVLDICIDPDRMSDGESFEWKVSLAAGISLNQWSQCSRIRMVCGQASLELAASGVSDWGQAARWLAGLQANHDGWEDQWLTSLCETPSPGHLIYICSSINERLARRLKLIRMSRGRTVTLVYAAETWQKRHVPWLERLREAGIHVVGAHRQKLFREVEADGSATGASFGA